MIPHLFAESDLYLIIPFFFPCAVNVPGLLVYATLLRRSTMGKLVKHHWARLILLTASFYQIAASIEAFIWPKIFWDFSTDRLDFLVKPVPYLQVINLLLGLCVLAFEWPFVHIPNSSCPNRVEEYQYDTRRYRHAAQVTKKATLPVWMTWLASIHRHIFPRLVVYPFICGGATVLMYQSFEAAIFYLIGSVVYLWAYLEGETVCPEPWTIPASHQRQEVYEMVKTWPLRRYGLEEYPVRF